MGVSGRRRDGLPLIRLLSSIHDSRWLALAVGGGSTGRMLGSVLACCQSVKPAKLRGRGCKMGGVSGRGSDSLLVDGVEEWLVTTHLGVANEVDGRSFSIDEERLFLMTPTGFSMPSS